MKRPADALLAAAFLNVKRYAIGNKK